MIEFTIRDGTRGSDFAAALRLDTLNSRIVWRISQRAEQLLPRAAALPLPVTVRSAATFLGCSKPTVMTFVRAGLIHRCRLRGRRPRAALWLDRLSVIRFVELCRDCVKEPPLAPLDFARIRARLEREGFAGRFGLLPCKLTIAQLSAYLRSSKTTVRRMLNDGAIDARRRSPRRWEIYKDGLPWWMRREN